MNASDLKIDLLRRIDQLNESELDKLYGELINVLNGHSDTSHWNTLSEAQQKGITDALRSIDSGKSMVHEDVMAKYRKRYSGE